MIPSDDALLRRRIVELQAIVDAATEFKIGPFVVRRDEYGGWLVLEGNRICAWIDYGPRADARSRDAAIEQARQDVLGRERALAEHAERIARGAT